jgi:hypothetical protein
MEYGIPYSKVSQEGESVKMGLKARLSRFFGAPLSY